MGNRYKYEVGERWLKGRYMMIKTGRRSESLHRYLMEEKLGRKLFSDEYVHHIDGNRLNNNIGNLQIVTALKHSNIHNKGRVPVNKGIPMSSEQKEKLRIIAHARPPTSDETKAKISASLKGRPSPTKGITMTSEQKDKIRKSVIKARKEKFWSTKRIEKGG